jgi:hypothetical protein
MTSMLWEFFVGGLLLYGLAFLGMAVLTRGQKPRSATWNESTNWSRAHPRVMTPLRSTTNWASAPRRRARSSCGTSNSSIRFTRPGRTARRVQRRRLP